MLTEKNCPPAIKALEPGVRKIALDRANALLERGTRQWRAVAMAVALVDDSVEATSTGPSIHVSFDHNTLEWTLCRDDEASASHRFSDLDAAIKRARSLAAELTSAVYVYDAEGAVIERFEAFGSIVEDGAYHVLPASSGGWAVKREGPEGYFERFDTKAEALVAGRELAAAHKSALVSHYEDGVVQRQHLYSR